METHNKKIIIIGAGISGLATAFWLHKDGYDVTILERNSEAGGAMESIRQDGFLFDRGPNSGLETTPLVARLVEGVNLKDEFVYSNPEGNKRYILRNGELHALPMSPPAMLKTKLFSASAKLRLLGEPFIGRSGDGYYQSVAQFVRRRLGQEFLDYAINPFVAGVYAGNPEELSVHSAFPKLYELEEKYGGLIIGTIKSFRERKKREEQSKQSAKMFSFLQGMQSLPKAIAAKLSHKIEFLADVNDIYIRNDKYVVCYNNAGNKKELTGDVVISTAPAYIASKYFESLYPEAVKHFDAIYYPPVMALMAGFKKSDIGQPLDGFGFLIPQKENKSFLGAIWSSTLFPARAPKDNANFTLFIGGARNREIFSEDKEVIIKRVIDEFKEIMKINGEPVFLQHRFWSKAIPQYNLGYIEHERFFDEFENKFKGIIISGNFRGGISVGDCIKNSDIVYKKAVKILETKQS